VTEQPINGTLSGTGAALSYTPTINFSGADSMKFRINDGILNSTEATVNITVTPQNRAPVATDVIFRTLSGVAPNLTYTPNPKVSGVDIFTYQVNDGNLDSNIATAGIRISPVNVLTQKVIH